jgi:uncharacterized protein YbbC (DUF1343 family)
MFGMDGGAYADALNARRIPGVHFAPATWTPRAGFWNGKELSGVEIDIDDPHTFPSVRTAVELMCAARDLAGGLHVHNSHAMDIDWGTDTVRKAVIAGEAPDAIVRAWQPGVPAFLALRDKYLLY